MNVIQPLDLETGYRVFQFRKECFLVITTKLYFPLHGGDPILFSDAYKELAELDSPFIDEGLPKINAEYLVFGNAKSINAQPVHAMDISARVGDKEKRLRVIGDRYWIGGLTGTTNPEPFTEMPLSWANAFGGKKHEINPEGKGTQKVKSPLGEELYPMPNLELPSQLLTSPKQNPTPAGFTSLMPDHAYRVKHMGTYDETWLKDDFPGYPKDFNFSALNTSMPDQHLSGFFAGGEKIELEGLHEEHSVIESTLPKFAVKNFLVKKGKEWDQLTTEDLIPVENKIDTLVLYPNQLMGMIVYRGMVKIESTDGSEFQYLLNAYEDASTQRSRSDYLNSLIGRIHPELSMRYALTTKDLIPSTVPCGMARLTNQETEPRIIMAEHISEKLAETKAEKTDEVKSQLLALIEEHKEKGLDTSLLQSQLEKLENPIKDPWQVKFEALADKLSPIDADTGQLDLMKMDFTAFDDLTKLSEEYAEFQKQQAKDNLTNQIDDAIKNDQHDVAEALSNSLEKMDQPAILPRPSDGQSTLAEIEALKKSGHNIDVDIENLKKQLAEAHNAQVEGYRMGAHMMDTGTPPLHEESERMQNWATEQIQSKGSLQYADLAGLDFSNMNLEGVDFTNCYLEQCNFRNANLRGANLTGAIAARCDFSYANLENTTLTDANLGGCTFFQTQISSQASEGLEIAKSDFTECNIGPINLSGITNLLEIHFKNNHFQSVDFSDAIFIESDFNKNDMRDCIFNQASFQKSNLNGSSVKNSQFIGVSFIESNLSASKWQDTDLTNVRIIADSKLSNCVFYHCILADATLRKIDISSSQFLNSTLNRIDLSEANLRSASFSGSIAKDALLISSELNHADLSNANFMASNFMQADLSNTNLSHSNLYGCEFLGSKVHHTDFSKSILDASKLQDWRPSKWQ